MTEAPVLVERIDRVAIVTMNRPAKLNALSFDLRRMLADAIRAADEDGNVRAIVLTGAGERAFSAGLDLAELAGGADGVFASAAFDARADPVAAILACRTPIVGAINGIAITGGFELALACDILICSDAARFADTHVKVEVLPGWGLSQRLSRAIGVSRAKEMSLTGGFIDAATAFAWGLVNRVVPFDALRVEAIGIAAVIARNPAAMVLRYKALIDDGAGMAFADALALEAERSAAFNREIRGNGMTGKLAALQADQRD